MNPLYGAIHGTPGPQQNPFGFLQNVMNRAQQIASGLQNPQQLVQRYLPDAPPGIQGDPEQLIGWLQQTGRVNPQTVQLLRQMMG